MIWVGVRMKKSGSGRVEKCFVQVVALCLDPLMHVHAPFPPPTYIPSTQQGGAQLEVCEQEVVALEPDPATNPHANGFKAQTTLLETEEQAQRVANPFTGRGTLRVCVVDGEEDRCLSAKGRGGGGERVWGRRVRLC